jgi:hypothetical protein
MSVLGKPMPVLGEHLSQGALSDKAMLILKELEDFLKSINFKQEENNLYGCNDRNDHITLYSFVWRLVAELHFITTKVQ